MLAATTIAAIGICGSTLYIYSVIRISGSHISFSS